MMATDWANEDVAMVRHAKSARDRKFFMFKTFVWSYSTTIAEETFPSLSVIVMLTETIFSLSVLTLSKCCAPSTNEIS